MDDEPLIYERLGIHGSNEYWGRVETGPMREAREKAELDALTANMQAQWKSESEELWRTAANRHRILADLTIGAYITRPDTILRNIGGC